MYCIFFGGDLTYLNLYRRCTDGACCPYTCDINEGAGFDVSCVRFLYFSHDGNNNDMMICPYVIYTYYITFLLQVSYIHTTLTVFTHLLSNLN